MILNEIRSNQNKTTHYSIAAPLVLMNYEVVARDSNIEFSRLKVNSDSLKGNSLLSELENTPNTNQRIIRIGSLLFIHAKLLISHNGQFYKLWKDEGLLDLQVNPPIMNKILNQLNIVFNDDRAI